MQNIIESLTSKYRQIRVFLKKLIGIEPRIKYKPEIEQEYHGEKFFGWSIPRNILNENSVVVDIGLGENISFSTSIIDKYQCTVHGFDPTPKSISYIEKINIPKFKFHDLGISTRKGIVDFFLPNDSNHVSATSKKQSHTGSKVIQVNMTTLKDLFKILNANQIDLLKVDIEGSEYDLFSDRSFLENLNKVNILCIEFHHRWKHFGAHSTNDVVSKLTDLGFTCTWGNPETNEEFTFLNLAYKKD